MEQSLLAPARPHGTGDMATGRAGRNWRYLRGWLALLGVVAAVVAVSQFFVFRPRPVDVRVISVDRGIVEETVVSTKAGSVRSRRVSDLSVEVAGTIIAIHAREGDRVRKGDPLISIDARDSQAALDSAVKERGVLEALVREARARELNAIRDHERLKELLKTNVVSQSDLDRAATEADMSVAARSAAEARLEAQKEAVKRARLTLEKCKLVAPFDGIVAELHVELGEWVVPGLVGMPGTVALRLIDPERLYVRAELDEVDIAELRTGLPARVTLDPFKGRRLHAVVTRLDPYVSEVQEQNRTLEVEAEIKEVPGDLDLKHGMSSDLEIILRSRSDVLRIPTQALMAGNRVLVAAPDGYARERVLKIGLKNWEYAEVMEGLEAGEPVIVSLESELLRDGVPIRVTEKEGP